MLRHLNDKLQNCYNDTGGHGICTHEQIKSTATSEDDGEECILDQFLERKC